MKYYFFIKDEKIQISCGQEHFKTTLNISQFSDFELHVSNAFLIPPTDYINELCEFSKSNSKSISSRIKKRFGLNSIIIVTDKKSIDDLILRTIVEIGLTILDANSIHMYKSKDEANQSNRNDLLTVKHRYEFRRLKALYLKDMDTKYLIKSSLQDVQQLYDKI